MNEIERVIYDLGKKNKLDELQKCIENVDEDELKTCVQNNLHKSNTSTFWDYLLLSFTDTPGSHQKRIEIVFLVLKELEEKITSNFINTQLVTRLCTELPKFKSEDLVKLCQFCIECIQKGNMKCLSWKDLLPELLSLLSKKDLIKYNQEEISGSHFKKQIITSLCTIEWSPEIITSLTIMFGNLSLSKEEHNQVVNKLGKNMSKLTCQELPAFVYQLLKLCRSQNGRCIFLRLQNYFTRIIYSKPEQDSESSSCTKNSLDLIGEASNHEIPEVESTILYHIYQCSTSDSECISDYISSLKKMTRCPEFALHPFQLSVLMSISCAPKFHDIVPDLIRTCIVKNYQEEMKNFDSCWFREMVPKVCQINSVISQVIKLSLSRKELVIEGMVNLAFVLLKVGCPLGRDVIAEKQWKLGSNILIKIIKHKRDVAPYIIQTLINYITFGNNVTQYINCIEILSSKMSLIMLNNQSCVVELIERLIQVPYNTANALLDAILPLMDFSPSLKDHLILVLKKALYSRKPETRKVAVCGFLKLLKSLKISDLVALSQKSCSDSSISSGQSLMTQVTLSCTRLGTHPGIISNEALSLEILGVLRRCLMQQAEVRIELYKGIYDATIMNFELAIPTLDILISHFNNYYVSDDEEELPPLKICNITEIKEANVILTEPLSELVQVCCLVTAKILLESENENENVSRFKTVLDTLCTRMANCELLHFELDDGTDLLDVLPESQEKTIILKETMLIYEALIGYKMNTWTFSCENTAQQIKSLFDGYKRLLDFSKTLNKTKKVDKATKKNSTKAKVFKLPDTILNLETLRKIIKLLYKSEVEWTSPAQANLLKPKADFHRFVMQATLRSLQNLKNSKIETHLMKDKHFENVTEIAQILYERCVRRLDDFTDFDCPTATLAAECFQACINVSIVHYENKFYLFLSKVMEENCENNLLFPFIETYQRILEKNVEEEPQDAELKKRNLVVLSTLSTLASQLPHENTLLSTSTKLLDWFKSYCSKKIAIRYLAPHLFTLYFDLHLKYKDSLSLFELFAKRLTQIYGVIDKEETVKEVEDLDVLNEATAQSALNCLFNTLKTILDEMDWIINRLSAQYLAITYPGEEHTETKGEKLKNKERGVCCQMYDLISITDWLISIRMPLGSLTESTLKLTTHLFNTLNSLVKYFITTSSNVNVAFQSARFERVVRSAGKNFYNVVYDFILYIENVQKQSRQKNVKSKINKETKLIPKLVYEMEQFRKSVGQLSNKTKVDLNKFMGTGSTRDFRIKALKEVLENMETDANSSLVEDDNSRDSSSSMEVDDENNQTSESDVDKTPPPKKIKK